MEPSETTPRPDSELLRRYLDSRDEAALTELITRHAALVRGVCHRVLGDSPDADDAFQATFLVLIRSGERIRQPHSLAAWLYGVAHRIALRQRRNRGRLTSPIREEQPMIANDPFTEMANQHDVALFDAELARLPEKYRAPIVLHHLEGKSQREVAAELGLTEGAVDGLLKRGRNELRIRLARQGVVFGVTLISVQTAQAAVAAASPQTLIAATVQGVAAYDPILHTEPLHTPATRLANQEISTMGLMQATKITAWTLVGSLFLGATGVGVSTMGRDLSLNVAGMVASELVVAQVAGDLPAELTANDSSTEPATNVVTFADGSGFVIADSLPEKRASLLEKKLEALREGAAKAIESFNSGRASFDVVATWQTRLNEAELAACKTDQERKDVLTKSLAVMTEFEQQVQRRAAAGALQGEKAAVLLATANRLDLEIALEQFAEKQTSSKTDPAGRQEQPSEVSDKKLSDDPIVKKLDEQLEISYVDTSFHDGMSYLEELFGFKIVVDDAAIHADGGSTDQQINLELSGVTLRYGLKHMLEPLGLDYIIEDGIMKIVSKQAAEDHQEMRIYKLPNRWNEWEDGFEALVKEAVGGEWKKSKATGSGGTMQRIPQGLAVKHNQRTLLAVERMLAQLDESSRPATGSQPEIKANVAPQPPAAVREGKLSDHPAIKQLDKETQIAFLDTPLRDAMSHIGQKHGFNIYVDDARIQSDGISPALSLNIELSGVKLRSALKLMLEPLGLDYIIDDEVMKIVSKKAAEEFHEMRIYPLGDDLLENYSMSERVEALVKDTAGGLWKTPGSPGPGGTVQWTTQGLAVRHNQRTHLAVEKLLAQLAQAADAPQPSETKPAQVAPPPVSETQTPRPIPPTGLIRHIDADNKHVWVNLGTDDKVRPRMTLKIPGPQPNNPKGKIEIVRVIDKHMSEAIIIEETLSPRPIKVNDRVEAPLLTGQSIALIGDIDLDGDGKNDRRKLYRLLDQQGMSIDVEVDDDGNRIGKNLSESTKFLVLGEIPALTGTESPLVRMVFENKIANLKDLRKEARLAGIRIISLNSLLEYIGQPPVNRTVVAQADSAPPKDEPQVPAKSATEAPNEAAPVKAESRTVNRSHAGESIAFIGDVDLDGDGKSDREMFFELLKAAGIKHPIVVDDTGQRAGEKLTGETNFLVVGDIPRDIRLKRTRNEREQFKKVMNHLKDLRKEARLNGVRIVSLNDFLEYIGEPKASRIPDPDAPPPVDFRQHSPNEVRIEASLHEVTEISFVDTSLRDALDYIEDLHNIEILINASEITGDGGSVDQQVSLELSGVALESALNRMLEPLNLDYIVKDEVLMITTATKASEWLELRVYPRSSLASAWGDIDPSDKAAEETLLKSIQEAVSGTWKSEKVQNGGTMSLTAAGLIVRQNQRTHREIANLLEQLRKASDVE